MLIEDMFIFVRACGFLGIAPFYQREKKAFQSHPWYPIFLILMTISAFGITLYMYLQHTTHSSITVHISQPIVDVCMNVHMMINLNFLQASKINEFLQTFNEVDQDFQKLHSIVVPKVRYVGISFLMINLVFIGMNITGFVFYGIDSTILHQITHFCGDLFSSYNINLIEFIKLMIVYSILVRFRLYNTMTIGMDAREIFVGQRRVDQYIKMHRKLCDLVDTFNHIYGWNILLSVIQTITYILRMCTLIVYGNTDLYLYIVTMWVSYFTIQLIIFASMCEKVSDEGQKSIALGFKALQRYHNIPVMREKLQILAEQATARCPQFSAAGFFNVDYSMLFTFVNLITTYIIVIVQFSQGSI